MVTFLHLYLVEIKYNVIIGRDVYRDVKALHGQLAMYVLK